MAGTEWWRHQGLLEETNPYFRNATGGELVPKYGTTPTSTYISPGMPSLTDYDKRIQNRVSQMEELQAQIQDLNEVKASFIDPEDWITKWLVDNNMRTLEDNFNRLSDEAEADYYQEQQATLTQKLVSGAGVGGKAETMAGWGQRGDITKRLSEISQRGQVRPAAETEPPIPPWMEDYLSSRGEIAPLGAQERMSAENLAMLLGSDRGGGYLGWHKAGRPTEFNQEYANALAQVPRLKEEYTREAESLFPTKAKLGTPKWALSR